MGKMKIVKRVFAGTCLAMLACAAPASLLAADVAQGLCLDYDREGKALVVELYDTSMDKVAPYGRPTGARLRFDVAAARMSMAPRPGDVLRIAYEREGRGNVALKVMNVSRRDARRE